MQPALVMACIGRDSGRNRSSNPGDGFDLIKDFRSINTAARLLVISVREDLLIIQRAFRAGTHGYFGRGFGASRLATELHLTVKTIETYQAHIKQKLGMQSAAGLSEKATHWAPQSMRRNLELVKLLKVALRF